MAKKAKKIGRPPGEPTQRVTVRIPVRLLKKKKRGETVTEWIVAAMESYCQKKP